MDEGQSNRLQLNTSKTGVLPRINNISAVYCNDSLLIVLHDFSIYLDTDLSMWIMDA